MVELQPQEAPEVLHYSCKKCRKVLFTPAELQPHSSKVKDIKAPVKKQVKKQNLA